MTTQIPTAAPGPNGYGATTTITSPTQLNLERQLVAVAILGFAVLFALAQYLHPAPFSGNEPHDGAAYLAAFHHQPLLHLAHFMEFICGSLLIVTAGHLYGFTKARFPNWALIMFIAAGTGAIMLIGNKAAICLTASAFDTLSEPELLALVPGLDVIIGRQGYLAVLALLPLLPVGFAGFGVLAWLSRTTSRWTAAGMFIGSALLVNPGIQALNTAGATVLAIALVPHALSQMRRLTRS